MIHTFYDSFNARDTVIELHDVVFFVEHEAGTGTNLLECSRGIFLYLAKYIG